MQSARHHSRIKIIGSAYSLLTRAEIESALMADALADHAGYVCVANVHTTMMGYFDPSYQRITNFASYAVPDGLPLTWAMRSLGATKQDRVRGPSLVRGLVSAGRADGIKHYFYGGSPAAVERLKSVLLSSYPGCEIVGAESPPFRPLEAISPAEWEETANRINGSGAHFIWVGLGAPKQERWMWEQRNRIQGIMLGVGAAFDLVSGRIEEAPEAFQKLGLEWLYRLAKEPRRLWRRYIFNNPAFLVLWAKQIVLSRFLGVDYVERKI